MEKVFQRIIQDNFSDLPGATVDAWVPFPQSLINELIEAVLEGNRNIESCRVIIHEQNRLAVRVKTSLLPLALDLKLKLDTSVDFASYSSPKLRAWMENNRWLGAVGSMLNVLPEGIKLYGNQIVIDLGYFLRKPEQRRILELVKSVGISTEEGKVILDVDVQVN
jgi:hypothetical protein